MEIAQFADGMASDSLLENIRLVGSDAGHVVTATDEYLEEIADLARQGFCLAFGGGGGRSDVDLIGAFEKGRIDRFP